MSDKVQIYIHDMKQRVQSLCIIIHNQKPSTWAYDTNNVPQTLFE